MSNDLGFMCSCCGDHHAELPMSYSTMAPDVWDPIFEGDPDSTQDRVREITMAVLHPA
jgi:hypothetical protein